MDTSFSAPFLLLMTGPSPFTERKIAMTVPVTNKIIPGQGPACESDFTMSFFLSQNMTAKFPAADDETVKVVQSPKFRAYVR